MNTPKEMGEVIRSNRIKLNMTQKDLAKKLFVEETTISRWECGIGYPNTTLFEPICRSLDISLFELLGNKRESKSAWVIPLISIAYSLLLLALILVNKSAHTLTAFDVLSIVFVSLIILTATFEIIFLAKKYKLFPLHISMLVFSYLLLVVFTISFLIIGSNFYHVFLGALSSIFVFWTSICFSRYILRLNIKRKNQILIVSIISLLLVSASFCLYYFGTIMALLYSSNMLYAVFFIFGIVGNAMPLLFFYILFRKKILLIIFIAIFVFIVSSFALMCLNIQFINHIFNILVYLGIANMAFINLFTLLFRKERYDY